MSDDTMSRPATVKDVLLAATVVGPMSADRVITLWIALTPSWTTSERDAFLLIEDRQHLLDLGSDLRVWLHKVGEKYLKMVASEYTCLREPRAETGRLTFATQSLLHEDELQDVLVECIEKLNPNLARSITPTEKPALRLLLLVILSLVTLYTDTSLEAAAAIMSPVLIHSSNTRGRYLSRLMGVLGFLLPAKNFKDCDVAGRLKCVWEELTGRGESLGLCVERTCLESLPLSSSAAAQAAVAGELPAPLPSGCVPLAIDTLYHYKRDLRTVQLCCRGDNEDDDEADPPEWRECNPLEVFEAVIAVGTRFKQRCRAPRQGANGETRSATFQLANPGTFMNALHAVLRFQGPVADRMQESGVLAEAQRCAGWVPLTVVCELLSDQLRQGQQEPPEDVEDSVWQVLTNHDHFGRFAVQLYESPGSRFNQQVCCRALYGHKLAKGLHMETVLVASRLVDAEHAATVPLCGWMNVEGAAKALQGQPGLVCYDNIPFVAVFSSAAVREFRRYKETLLQSTQYDEKLKSDARRMTFVEVALRAVTRDPRCQVYTSDSPSRWYVAPHYTCVVPDRHATSTSATTASSTSSSRERTKPSGKMLYRPNVLPKFFLTGRQVTLVPCHGHGASTDGAEGGDTIDCVRVVVREEAATAACKGDGDQDAMRPREDPAEEFAQIVSTEKEAETLEGQVYSTQRWSLQLGRLPPFALAAANKWEPLLTRLQQQQQNEEQETGATSSLFPFKNMPTATELEAFFDGYPRTETHKQPGGEPGQDSTLEAGADDDEAWAAALRRRRAPGQLNMSDFEPVIRAFISDSEQYMTLLRVPKVTDDGAQYGNRSDFLKQLKEFLRRQDLTCVLRKPRTDYAPNTEERGTPAEEGSTSPTDANARAGVDSSPNMDGTAAQQQQQQQPPPQLTPDVFEVRKSFLWKRSELEKLVADLGLGAKVTESDQLSVIRTALTRECENKGSNYERLEFLGDAIMDFLVTLDTCLLRCELLHTGCRQDAVPLALCVVMIVCRNSVIAQLLPTSVTAHLANLYEYTDVAEKVKADMFEALIGAVYELGLGLEEVRRFLMRLFTRLSELQAGAAASPPTEAPLPKDLRDACEACPYVADAGGRLLRDLFHFSSKIIRIIPPSLRKLIVPLDEAAELPCAHNTHLAMVGLPRIQAKGYATHFTTGQQYSYRRIHSRDATALWHRLLRLVAQKQAVFVNETVTHNTHLVFDYDGEDIRSFGALRHFWNWYRRDFGCPGSMLVLDCTGPSPSKQNAMKRSCHVHFPQITLTLTQLGEAQARFREYLRDQLERDKRLMGALQTALRPHANTAAPTARRLFSSVRVHALWRDCRAAHGGTDEPAATPETQWMRDALPTIWPFCPGEDLARLSHVCRLWRRSALLFAETVLSRDTAYLCRSFGVRDDDQMFSPGSPLSPQVVTGRVETCEDDMVVVETDGASADGTARPRRWLVPGAWLRTAPALIEGIAIDTVVDASLEKSKKLRMYLCDKCDMKYGAERRPLLLDTVVTAPGAVARAVSEKTVRDARLAAANHAVTRNSRTWRAALTTAADATKGSWLPKDLMDGAPSNDDLTMMELPPLKWPSTGDAEQDDSLLPMLASQSTVMRLTSLRSPSYRDVHGRTYEAWHDSDVEVDDAQCGVGGGTRDELPTFAEVLLGQRRVSASLTALRVTQWGLWVNAFTALVPKEAPDRSKHAVSPSWWAFDSGRRRATFFIAGEPVFHVSNCGSLHEALRHDGRDGMRRLARWLVPHVDYPGDVRVEVAWTEPKVGGSLCRGFFPLFVLPGSSGSGGAKKKPVAPSAPTAQKAPAAKGAVPKFSLGLTFRRMQTYTVLNLDGRLPADALNPIRSLLRMIPGGTLDGGHGTVVLWEHQALRSAVSTAVPWLSQIPRQIILSELASMATRLKATSAAASSSPAPAASRICTGFGAIAMLHSDPNACAAAIRDAAGWLQTLFSPSVWALSRSAVCVAADDAVLTALREVLG